MLRVNKNRPELNPDCVPTEIEVAWAAGVYEGEGHCRVSHRSVRALQATVVQKDPEILYRLRSLFGGSVNTNGAACYALDVCGDRARIFLAMIFPFMSSRRKAQIDAIKALDFMQGESPAGLSYEQMKDRIIEFNQEFMRTLDQNLELKKAKQDAYNKLRAADPVYMEEQRQRSERNRASRKAAKEAAEKARGIQLVNSGILHQKSA